MILALHMGDGRCLQLQSRINHLFAMRNLSELGYSTRFNREKKPISDEDFFRQVIFEIS